MEYNNKIILKNVSKLEQTRVLIATGVANKGGTYITVPGIHTVLYSLDSKATTVPRFV